jgi:pimeloyl-ACP methyl ester carboxylesterase
MAQDIGVSPVPLAELRRRYSLPESRFGTFSGIPGHYTDEGEGPVILFLHSSFLDLTSWADWVAEYRRDHRVICLDRLRFGLTGHAATGPLDYADEHGFVCAFVDAMGLDRFTIVGSSSGGLVAARYAADHPERVERAILINFPLGHGRIRSGGDAPLPPPDQPEAMMRALLERNLVDGSVVTDALVARLTDFSRREDPGGAAAGAWTQAAKLTEADRAAMLGRIAVPTLVLWSAQNRTLPVANGEAAFAAVGSAEKYFTLIEGAGHMFPLERGAETAAAMRPFLRGKAVGATVPA